MLQTVNVAARTKNSGASQPVIVVACRAHTGTQKAVLLACSAVCLDAKSTINKKWGFDPVHIETLPTARAKVFATPSADGTGIRALLHDGILT